jgi:hypothetical protein
MDLEIQKEATRKINCQSFYAFSGDVRKVVWPIRTCNSVNSTDISEECHWTCTELHGVITQNILFSLDTAVRTSNHDEERDYLDDLNKNGIMLLE